MIKVRMDEVVHDANLLLSIGVLLLAILKLSHGQLFTAQELAAFGRLVLIYWVIPIAFAYILLNLYETWDLAIGWVQYEAAFERLVGVGKGAFVISTALIVLSFL